MKEELSSGRKPPKINLMGKEPLIFDLICIMGKEKQVFGTTEWATDNENFINGCFHDCKYCYSKEMAIRFKRKRPDNWKEEVVNTKHLNKKFRKKEGYVMFPSSHDITPENSDLSIQFLGNILRAGNDVLVVTKPHFEVIEKICQTFSHKKNKILFRFTIGSCDSQVLKFWEPNAPTFEERLDALKFAYENGFKTSVSCEPILDIATDDLIKLVIPYVTDAVWIGKPNFLLRRLKMNGISDSETLDKARELVGLQSDKWILTLYEKHKDNSQIKWKESIKKIVNIEIPTIKGLDE
jgi:DNA repair photolyase